MRKRFLTYIPPSFLSSQLGFYKEVEVIMRNNPIPLQKEGWSGFRMPRLSRKWAPYIFISPAVILFLLFMVYPIIYSFLLSLQKQDNEGNQVWNGLANYQRLLGDSKFLQALGNTVLILV